MSKIASQQELMNQKIHTIHLDIKAAGSSESKREVGQNETPNYSDGQFPLCEIPTSPSPPHVPPLDTAPTMEVNIIDGFDESPRSIDSLIVSRTRSDMPIPDVPPNLNQSQSLANNVFEKSSTDTTSTTPASPASPSSQFHKRKDDSGSSRARSQPGTAFSFEETFLNAPSSNISNITINHTAGDSVVITNNDYSRRQNFGNVYTGMGERRSFDSRYAGSVIDRSGYRSEREDDWREVRAARVDSDYDMANLQPYGLRERSGQRTSLINDPQSAGRGRRRFNRPEIHRWRSYDTTGNTFGYEEEVF
ncbi:hypothetical protein D9757_011101 [Collybiopsis confluens]|uniref:Uncharacterized protein n=1 Tax=Collybiopsis confluens TaxID=2823264 RepID=A0A8H5LX66_9AGAR|nr:hypothetical protein D9757_011101 [Collybiopsis confluens]